MAMRNDDLADWLSDVDGRVTELVARLSQVEAANESLRNDYHRLRAGLRAGLAPPNETAD